jgi:hypothetical protein
VQPGPARSRSGTTPGLRGSSAPPGRSWSCWAASRCAARAGPGGCWRPATRRPGTCRPRTGWPARWSRWAGTSFCEWKGVASYLDVVGGDRRESGRRLDLRRSRVRVRRPAGAVAVYPARMDSCTVDGERVRPQDGGFYGGWVTDDVVGPFKGAPARSAGSRPSVGRVVGRGQRGRGIACLASCPPVRRRRHPPHRPGRGARRPRRRGWSWGAAGPAARLAAALVLLALRSCRCWPTATGW